MVIMYVFGMCSLCKILVLVLHISMSHTLPTTLALCIWDCCGLYSHF